MRRFGIGFLLLCLAGGLLVQGQPAKVHLGWSQNDVYETMTVVWHSPSLDAQRVVYDGLSQSGVAGYKWEVLGTGETIQPTTGTDGSAITTTAMPGYYYKAELTGLKPGETYHFRVVDGSGAATQEWAFRTIEPSQEIRFAYAGDSQRPYETPEGPGGQLLSRPTAPANWPYMRNLLTQQAASEKPDFILVLGDFVARGNKSEQWENWLDAWQENAVTSTGRMIPIVPVVGNHDLGGYPDVDSSYEWILGLFAMPQPMPGRPWYSLDFPELHLTVLAATAGHTSGIWASAESEANEQRNWLRADLATAPQARWKLVAFHYNYLGCYASCTGYPSDVYAQEWTRIFQGYDVDMVMMGHTHNYTRTWPVTLDGSAPCGMLGLSYNLESSSEDGITYITQGTWGGPPNQVAQAASCSVWPWIAAAASHPSIGLIELGGSTLFGEIRDTSSGSPLDAFELPYQTTTFGTPGYSEVIP